MLPICRFLKQRRARTPRSARGPACAAALVASVALVACGKERAQPAATSQGAAALTVTERATLRVIGIDTLSDSARIVSISGEPDGDAIVFTFADPERGISAGLGLIDHAHASPRLLWPDSVTSVSWPAPHRLTFTANSGKGLHVALDIHAPTIQLDTVLPAGNAVPLPSDSSPRTLPAAVQARAAAYIDSIRTQPGGVPQGSALRYAPVTLLPSPDNRFAAAYVVATGPSGEQTNPAWYLLQAVGMRMQPIDSITGSAASMSRKSASWLDGGAFVYAKGKIIYEARIALGAGK